MDSVWHNKKLCFILKKSKRKKKENIIIITCIWQILTVIILDKSVEDFLTGLNS